MIRLKWTLSLILAGLSLSLSGCEFAYFFVQKIVASDAAPGDDFGEDIANWGSFVVVGAGQANIGGNNDQGAAYVYERNGSFPPTETQELTASDGEADDNFGIAVAIHEETIVCGATDADNAGDVSTGAAYVFERQGGVWVETAKLTPADGEAGDDFGESVANFGNTIVCGSQLDDVGGNSNQGSAYVFEKQGGNWVQVQKLTASDGAENDRFHEVEIFADWIIVGADLADVGANENQGAVYLYRRVGGIWPPTETQKVTASDGAANDNFGDSVSIWQDRAIVGANFADIGVNADQGAAYVLELQGAAWAETQKLLASDGAAEDEFGESCDIFEDCIVVGTEAEFTPGAAYVFNEVAGGFVETDILEPEDGEVGDDFGIECSIHDGLIAVAAEEDDDNRGSGYLFERVSIFALFAQHVPDGQYRVMLALEDEQGRTDQLSFIATVHNGACYIQADQLDRLPDTARVARLEVIDTASEQSVLTQHDVPQHLLARWVARR